MNITRENIDALNAVLKVDIQAADYKERVEKILSDYRKKADIPGFRKGQVPMGMVRKQYGKAVLIEEINKILQESLNKYLVDEKLDILGNPLPKVNENFSWDTEDFSFEFELGLAPEFDVDLKAKNDIVAYNIEATDKLLDEEVANIQTRYGKLVTLEVSDKDSNIRGTFVNEEKEINKNSSIAVVSLKGDNKDKLIGVKVGDVIELATKDLFEDVHELQHVLGVSHDEAHHLDINVTFTVEEITKREKAELDQEFFDKLFADGSVKTVSELKEKIKEGAEKQFKQQADQHLLYAVTEYLVETTKFNLPVEFLQKWLQTAGEKELSVEEAKTEYEKSEKGLRYQLIEGKLMKDNNINVDYKELIDYAKDFIKAQMAQFGNTNPTDEEVTGIAQRVLSNQEEVQRLQQQLITQKMLDFYKENMTFDSKTVDYEVFIEEAYKK